MSHGDKVGGVPIYYPENLPAEKHEEFSRAVERIPDDVRKNISAILFVKNISGLRLEEGEPPKAAHTYPNSKLVRTGPGVFDFKTEYIGSSIEIWGGGYWNRTLWHEAGHVHHQAQGILGEVHISRADAELYADKYAAWVANGAQGKFEPPKIKVSEL